MFLISSSLIISIVPNHISVKDGHLFFAPSQEMRPTAQVEKVCSGQKKRKFFLTSKALLG